MEKLIVNEELKKWITPLTSEEYAGLEKSITTEGCRDAIIKWWNPGIGFTIIDGHNRFEICQKHDILFDTIERKFDNIEDVKDWIDSNQLSRRNLTDSQRELIIGRRYNREKNKHGGDRKSSVHFGHLIEASVNTELPPVPEPIPDLFEHNVGIEHKVTPVQAVLPQPAPVTIAPKPPIPAIKTAEKLAEEYKVSPTTVRRYGNTATKFEELQKTNPKLADDIFTGKKTFAEVRKEEKKEEIKKQIEKKSIEFKKVGNIEIFDGDVFEVIKKIEDQSIDLLVTDPPYFILNDTWDTFRDKHHFLKFTENWLSAVINKIKRDTGRIYISFSQWYQYDFYEILKSFNFFGFEFKQNIIWYYKNNNQPSNRKEYRYMYEPIFYLYGKSAKNLNFTPETYGEIQQNVWEVATPQSNFKEGKFHPAQKPIELFKRIILTGSYDGDTVLDCFAGSGTTGVVCKDIDRKCILIEKNPEYIKIIKSRLA